MLDPISADGAGGGLGVNEVVVVVDVVDVVDGSVEVVDELGVLVDVVTSEVVVDIDEVVGVIVVVVEGAHWPSSVTKKSNG